MAAEARVIAEAEFKRKQESAHGEWLEERKKLREETAPQHGICVLRAPSWWRHSSLPALLGWAPLVRLVLVRATHPGPAAEPLRAPTGGYGAVSHTALCGA